MARLLCQSLNSGLYLEKKGRDAESVDAGKSASFLLAELAFGKKSSPYTNTCLSFPARPHSSARQPGHFFLWCLPSTKPFHNGAYLELWEQTCYRYEVFVTQGFRARLHNLYSNEYVGINRFAPMDNNSLSEKGVTEFGPCFLFC